MHRKHFIRLSGLSLAGLITTHRSWSHNFKEEEIITALAEVWIQSGTEWFRLQPAGAQQYSYRDSIVKVIPQENVLRVFVTAPSQLLNMVRLVWNHSISTQSKLLGDHWERTYGDVSWQRPLSGKKMPWYFLDWNGERTSCFGVKTGCASICSWQVTTSGLQLDMDTRSGGQGVRLGLRELHAADVLAMQSREGETAFAAGKRFCAMMCASPRLATQPVYGINDWYFAYGNNSYELIMQHTGIFADLITDTHNRPFSVIDAGWAQHSTKIPNDCCWQNDAAIPNNKFRDMHGLAGDIVKKGMRPGIWVRPLCARFDDKKTLLLPAIPGRDNPDNPILDPTIPENLERIRGNIRRFGDWGYEMVKHDYTTYDLLGKWGFQMKDDLTTPGWRFYADQFTTAEIMLQLYTAIREGAGNRYLIGCNTMSHLSAGIFELNRVGDDTSGQEWDRTRKMGVNTLAFRGIQNNHFYAADGDCVGLTTSISWAKNKQWMQLVAESGTPLFISGQPAAIENEQKQYIKNCFSIAAKKIPTGEALDWFTTPWPTKWKLNGITRKFDWG